MIRINPIVKKDMKVSSRSMKMSWGLFGYEAVLALAFLLAMSFIKATSRDFYSYTNIYHSLVYLFPVLAISQVCIVALIMPIITASSISGERERQTFDIMLTTCMSPFSIVIGKVTSAMLRILLFVAASTPIMALSFVVGGMSWANLLYFLLSIMLLSLFCGSIGIFCSSMCRKTISAVILSFVIYFFIFGMSFLPLLIMAILSADKIGPSLLPLLFNPVVFFEEFFMQIMTGQSLLGGGDLIYGANKQGHAFFLGDVDILTYYLAYKMVWMFASAGCILLESFFFMILAALRVNPLNGVAGKKKKKS